MKKRIVIALIFVFSLFSGYSFEISQKNDLLEKTKEIESLIAQKKFEQLIQYIDDDMGLFITDNIKMNSFYSIHISKKMLKNIQHDEKKYAFFIDDDPRSPAWTTLFHYMESRFPLGKKELGNISFNDFYKGNDLDLENSLIKEWNDMLFIEYYYLPSKDYVIDWLSVYFIFKKINGDYKLVGLTRNY